MPERRRKLTSLWRLPTGLQYFYSLFLPAAFAFAQRALAAFAILARALALIVRFPVFPFTFAHLAFWAAAILARPAAEIPFPLIDEVTSPPPNTSVNLLVRESSLA